MITKQQANDLWARVESPAKLGGFVLIGSEALDVLRSLQQVVEALDDTTELPTCMCLDDYTDTHRDGCAWVAARALVKKWNGEG